ncbi:hypothetical protein IQ266_25300 [filamentous cyanobacterium LEGE 11480]|uniref:TraX family protein n=1 Tax=Romeriopsis navalis LEGE 11480 TaxID=2777977 RepID=A0A928VQT2_9CYAN|nr:conjugal transfer protein TraX [Romeriopsis navalis]MBE9033058.1 hypothetical protein [Romeriopsis navalis LEGE 11480]
MPGLTSFQIKLLAAGFMVIDHVGRLFFPNYWVMQAIGRLSFPLFAWLAAQGEQHTSNLRNYLLRLLGVGLITQPIYLAFIAEMQGKPFSWSIIQWNMLFSLAYGVWLIRCVKQQTTLPNQVALATFMALIAQFLQLEGGIITAGSIYAMSLLGESPIVGYGLFVALHLLYLPEKNGWIELFAIFAPLIVLLYNAAQGPPAKWLYGFYPLHFAALLGLKLYLLPHYWPQLTTALNQLRH